MNNQKKILIFTPSIEDGGVEKNLYNLTNFFSKRIKNISLITANNNKKNNFNKRIDFISPNNNFWNNRNRFLKTSISIILFLNFFFKEESEIIIFSFNSNLYAILLAKIFNCKILIRSNASPHGYSNNFFKKKIFINILKLADEIIVNSFDFKKQMKIKFNVKSTCIYNPLENINYLKKLAIKKINFNYFKSKQLKIISVGRLVKQKDHITLLKAINILSKKIKFKLLIMGNGEEKINLINFVKEKKLYKSIKIIPYQKNPYPYIYQSNLLILSSLYEGLPNVLLEALALKKFIISSNCPSGPKEILANQKYGELFEVKNYKQLSKKIEFFHNNKKKFNKRISLGYKSLNRFNFKSKCNLYLNIIHKYL